MRFLFVDRIVQLEPGEYASGVKHVTRDDVYLRSDGHGRLQFVPSLIGETLGQLAAWNVMQYHHFEKRPVAGVVAEASVFRPAFVGETLLLESWIDALDTAVVQYHSAARVGEEVVFTIDGALGPLLPMEDFIDPAEVRRQFNEINRPGDWNAICQLRAVENESRANVTAHATPDMEYDHIIACVPQQQILAEKRITRAARYFPDHFPRKPVLPMSVLLECQLSLAEAFIQRSAYAVRYQFSMLRRIKMNDFIYPGDVLVTELTVRQQTDADLVLHARTSVDGRRVCILDMVFKGII